MPVFLLRTNVPSCKIPADFWEKTTEIVANMLDKPASATMCIVMANNTMTFGGTTAPNGLVSLYSIGCISRDENKKWSKILFPHIEKELGIPQDRLFITYNDLDRNNLAWKGITFDDILPPDSN